MVSAAQLFVAVLGGAPEILVPDNLRSGVTRAHRYEPEINRTYQERVSRPTSLFRGTWRRPSSSPPR
jgi:hypothetical protein